MIYTPNNIITWITQQLPGHWHQHLEAKNIPCMGRNIFLSPPCTARLWGAPSHLSNGFLVRGVERPKATYLEPRIWINKLQVRDVVRKTVDKQPFCTESWKNLISVIRRNNKVLHDTLAEFCQFSHRRINVQQTVYLPQDYRLQISDLHLNLFDKI